jgi:hypothetical protein
MAFMVRYIILSLFLLVWRITVRVVVLERRNSFREKSVLLDELLRDLEDILKLAMNVLSLILDFISRRLARQDKM